MPSDAESTDTPNHFGDLLGIAINETDAGFSQCSVDVTTALKNSADIVHGGVLFSLADTGMWAALNPTLAPDEFCSTVEAKIQFIKPVRHGTLVCETTVRDRGGSIAHLESTIACGDDVVAAATGTYFIGTQSA